MSFASVFCGRRSPWLINGTYQTWLLASAANDTLFVLCDVARSVAVSSHLCFYFGWKVSESVGINMYHYIPGRDRHASGSACTHPCVQGDVSSRPADTSLHHGLSRGQGAMVPLPSIIRQCFEHRSKSASVQEASNNFTWSMFLLAGRPCTEKKPFLIWPTVFNSNDISMERYVSPSHQTNLVISKLTKCIYVFQKMS